ncbi:MAG: cytochrome-c oxidase, cbb3-type subunit I, partial [Micropepsaceae bacterium]
MQPVQEPKASVLGVVAVPALLVGFLILGFWVAARSNDPLMVTQAWTFMAGIAVTLIAFVRRYADGIPEDDRSAYANDVVKAGVVVSMFWGIAGMLVGVVIALQLAFPTGFYFPDLPFTNFGRLRPLH